MAPTNKTNFKSYESAVRLLAAVVATAKPKLDFKEIAKLFGESTADGIEWQFRSIKKLGKAQQEAAKKGEDTSKVTIDGVGTPKTNRTIASTPGSRRRFASATTTPTTTGKRARGKKIDEELDDDLDDEEVEAFDTPTHKKPKFTDGADDQAAPPSLFGNGQQPVSLFGNGQQPVSLFSNSHSQVAAGPPSFAAPPPPKPAMADDDDLVEINSSQFSQSSAKSKLNAATRPKVPKQEPTGADMSTSFASIPSAHLDSSQDVAASFCNTRSFNIVPAHDNSFLSNQNHDDLAEDEV